MNALALRDVHFSYDGQRTVLDDVSLTIERGAAVAIKGRSGSGKSTLAMIACGVIPKAVPGYFSGCVSIFGEDIADRAINETAGWISMVFQDPESQLFAPAVIDEVAFGPENLCMPSCEIHARIDAAMRTVGMESYVEYSPTMLSGGQQQLIAFASILALQPEIIILDEVAAQIDADGVLLIKKAVRSLKEQGKTVLVIEHGDVFLDIYDTVYFLENGHIVAGGV